MIRLPLPWMALVFVLACHASPPPPPTTQPPIPTPAPKGGPLSGTWKSAFCGDRAYEREITFFSNGHFAGRDYVAPCPPNTLCVWSGIIEWKGTYTVGEGRISLVLDPNPGGRQDSRQPTSLDLGADGVPAEGDCRYSPAP